MTPGWTPLVTDYLPLEALTPGVKNTFWAICSFAYGGKVGCFPSQATIAKRAGCSLRTVGVHVQRLVSLSLLIVIRKKRRGYYYLLPHKAKGKSWADSIADCVANLPPAVHEYKSLKAFLAEERLKPRFTDRELRKVKQDIREWGEESRKVKP